MNSALFINFPQKYNIRKTPIGTKTIFNKFDILKYKIMTEDLDIYQTVEEGIDKLLKKHINKALFGPLHWFC